MALQNIQMKQLQKLVHAFLFICYIQCFELRSAFSSANLVFLCLEVQSLKIFFIHTAGPFFFHRCYLSSLYVWQIYLTSMFISWLPFAKTSMHQAQAQANDIISKHSELLLLTTKNFSDFIKDKNLQKKTCSIYIQQTEFVFMIWMF